MDNDNNNYSIIELIERGEDEVDNVKNVSWDYTHP